MKKRLLAALLATICAMPAYAKEFQLPDANPAVKVALPDSWNPEAIDTGAQAESPNGLLIFAETATLKSVKSLVSENFDFLKKQGVTIDPDSQKEADETINGMSMSMLQFSGSDKDGPAHITMVVIPVKDNLALILTCWGSPDAEKADDKDIRGILGSVQKM